jgi:hypothetical protein
MTAWITKTGVEYGFSSTNEVNSQIIKINYVNANTPDLSRNMKREDSSDDSSILSWDEFIDNNIIIHNIFNGIDIRYYFNNESDGSIGFRYDFIVNPGADLSQIKIKLDGTDKYEINNVGELVLHTSIGEIKHGRLFTYQNILSSDDTSDLLSNELKEIQCKFIINQDNTIGFLADNYDKSKPLIIDPLVWSTVFGGGDLFDYSNGNSISIDSSGNVYLTGYTGQLWNSTDYPTTVGAYDRVYNGATDAFVTVLNTNATALVYSTFLGGSANDYSYELVLDPDNNTYISGKTTSSNFPVTNGVYKTTYSGPEFNNFVTKLNNTGSSLIFSTYIGKSNISGLFGSIYIDIDSARNSVISGITSASTYPATVGAYDISYNGGNSDAIETKINNNGTALIFSTFLGGSSWDFASAIKLDNNGNSYIDGFTTSSNFPISLNAYDNTYNNNSDAFVAKLDPNGASLVYSSYIGGTSADSLNAISLDNDMNVTITGLTKSTNFPVSPGAYDVSFNGISDVFVSKINADASGLIYSTFLGGSSYDQGYSIYDDNFGGIYITGNTSSSNFPTTNDGYDRIFNYTDAFISLLKSDGSELLYSTYLGGGYNDYGYSLTLDENGYIYVTGCTISDNFPVTPGVFKQDWWDPATQLFVTKLKIAECDSLNINPLNFNLGDLTCSPDTTLEITINNPMKTSVRIKRYYFTSGTDSKLELLNFQPFKIGAYNYTNLELKINNNSTGLIRDTLVLVLPTACDSLLKIPINGNIDVLGFQVIAPDTVDMGKTCTFENLDAYIQVKNTSSRTTKLNRSQIAYPFWVASPDPFNIEYGIDESRELHIKFVCGADGVYYQDLTITDSCGYTKTIVLKAEVNSPRVFAGPDQTICEHDSVSIGNPATGGFPPYTYNWIPTYGLSNSKTVPSNASPSVTTDYILIAVDAIGCITIDTVRVNVNPAPITTITGPVSVCENQSCTYNIPNPGGISGSIDIEGATNVDSTDKQNIIITWGAIGTGYIKLKHIDNLTGCTDSVSIEINISTTPHPDIVGDTNVCSNILVHYTTSNSAMSNNWTVIGGKIIGNSGASSIDVLWTNDPNARIKLVQSNTSGCIDSIERDITIKLSPIVNLPDIIQLCPDFEYKLEPIISSGVPPWIETKWTPSTGISDPNALDLHLTLSTPGIYIYYLSVTGSNGCVGTDSVIVIVNAIPMVELSREFIDFGSLEPCQSTKIDSLVITNTGTEDVVINKIGINSGFSIDSPAVPFNLKTGEKKTIIVRYTSTSSGQVTADINIVGSPCNFTKSFQCTVINPEMIVSINPATIAFGQSMSCDSIAKDTTVILTNTGSSNITFYFDQTVLNNPFSIVSPTNSTVVTPGNNEKVKLHYEPKTSGNFSDILVIPFVSGSCKDTLRIPLSGINENSVMSSNLQNIDFQDISGCDISRDTIITIQNTGTNDLTIIGLEPDSVFTSSQINTNVPAGQSRDIILNFSTNVIGSYSGELIVKYEPCGRIDTFLITGNKLGVAFAVTDSIDFGEVLICKDQSKSLQFTIENNSSSGIDGYIQSISQINSLFKTDLIARDSVLNGQVYTYDVSFEPDASMPDGDYYGTLDFVLLPCNISKTIKLHAIKSSISLSNTVSIDFGNVAIGETKDDTIHIVNSGKVDVTIESITNITPPFELISTSPSLPTTLKANDELLTIIGYTPTDTTGDTQIIKQISTIPCNIEISTTLSGLGISEQNIIRKASVYIDPLDARTGQTVSMPLMLRSSENLITNGQTREFSAKIRFNATLLSPNETPDNDIITNGERTIEVSGNISAPNGVMKMMNYTAALGNTKCTDLIIDTVIWKNIKVETILDNGKFCLTNVCPEGGDRLLNPNGNTQIISIHPNPTSGAITIEYKLSESGYTEFLIMNYLGETVKKVVLGEIKDFNSQSLTLNLDDLSTGQYFLVLRTPTEAVRQIVIIVR